MKVLLTGATGLVGNALGQRLAMEGHQIVALVRNIRKARAKISYPCELRAWDFQSPLPKELLAHIDGVVHLAGAGVAEKRWSQRRKRELHFSRVQPLKSLADSLNGRRLPVLISASAIGFYGDRRDEELTEQSKPGKDFLAALCQAWEAAAHCVPADRLVITRIGIVLAARGGFLRQVVPLSQSVGAGQLGSGRQYLSWIHIEDLVHILATALSDSTMQGVYNAVSPHAVTNKEWTLTFRRSLRLARSPAVPAVLLRILYGELGRALVSSQRVVPARLLERQWSFDHSVLPQALSEIFPDPQPREVKCVFEQWVPSPLPLIWEFFNNEENLERLTPSSFGLKVVSKDTLEIQEGTRIDYRFRFAGLRLHGQVEITDFTPIEKFTDAQVKGPFKSWTHQHQFEILGAGVLIRDTIRVQLPLGQLGMSTTTGLVLKQIEKVFSYRSQVISEIFWPQ